jgi:predicted transcriptional regulator
MLKREAKKLVVDHGRSKYSATECQVLQQIIAAVRMYDPKTQQVEDCQCVSKIERLARVAHCSVRTVQNAIKRLEADGSLTVHRNGVRHAYTVTVESLKSLPYYKEALVDQQEASNQRAATYRAGLRQGADIGWKVCLPMTVERLRNGNKLPSDTYSNSATECARASHVAVTALNGQEIYRDGLVKEIK